MSEPPRSARFLANLVVSSPGLEADVRADPKALLRLADQVTAQLPPPAYVTDPWTYRIVVLALGVVCVAAIGGAIYLSAVAQGGTTATIPDVLTALGAAAIGALAGLLAPSPTTRG